MRISRAIGQVLALGLLSAAAVFAADKPEKKVFLDPKQAGVDFMLQGEYSGDITTTDGMSKIGVQVIALGDGKFRAVGYPGGLPGDDWSGENKVQVESQLENGEVRFGAKGIFGVLRKDGTITVENEDGQALGKLKKVHRKSDTLGQKPPKGAVVLFDGASADKFQGGKMTKDGLLEQGATSKQKFQGFKLHLEFMLSFMPDARGQGRSNSGVYMQGRYEVQVLDSFGLEGKNNECGGIYTVSDPSVNMCYPPLSWQTYDVDFTPAKFDEAGKKTADARMTVRQNGVLIQDDVKIPKSTTAAPVKEGPQPGPLYIQNHGNPVRYRNIWLVEK